MTRLSTPLLLATCLAAPAFAGNVLFINYNGSDARIEDALAVDGHVITNADVPPGDANSYFATTDLTPYCAVVWSTAYQYDEDLSTASGALSSWAGAGGYVLVTAPDGIRSSQTYPSGQPHLLQLIGGSSATDSGNIISPVINSLNALSGGLVDIRGETPPPISDTDSVCGPLSADTLGVATVANSSCPNDDGYAWTLRSLGLGAVGYMGSGNFSSSTSDDPDWASTSIPGDGVFNAGLRNFVHQGCSPLAAPQAVPTLPTALLWLTGLLTATAASWAFRRRRAA